jgi:hypothetical protein
MKDQEAQVKEMIAKAAKAEKSDDALKFSQAALNAANAMISLRSATKQWTTT